MVSSGLEDEFTKLIMKVLGRLGKRFILMPTSSESYPITTTTTHNHDRYQEVLDSSDFLKSVVNQIRRPKF